MVLGQGQAGAGEIAVSGDDCRYLATHVPDTDVAYRPGEDADGEPVTPADLNGGGAIRTPERITIAIEIPLTEFLGAESPARLGDAKVEAGQVVLENGQLTYNGQPLPDAAAHAVAEHCRRLLGQRP